jgi:GH35 family endo-1,4-beta-xylanase
MEKRNSTISGFKKGTTALLLFVSLGLSSCKNYFADSKDAESQQRAARAVILAKLQQSVQQKRQGEAAIRVLDARGQSTQGTRLIVEQTAHDFSLGCRLSSAKAADNVQEYRARFRKIFNTAVVTPAGSHLTAEQTPDTDLDWAQANSTKLIGSLLISTEQGTAKSVNIKEHVLNTVRRYRGKISLWQITHGDAISGISWETAQRDFREALAAAREADAQAQLIVSADGIFSESPVQRDHFIEMLRQLSAENVSFDAIGVEASGAVQSVNKREWLDPLIISSTLDRLAAFKKPIHILDFSAPANQYVEIAGNYRQGSWDIYRQDEYAREVTMLCLSHPQVVSFSYRKFMDEDVAVAGNGVNEDGLLDHKLSPRPILQKVSEMFDSKLRASNQMISKTEGSLFRGFYGDYRVRIFPSGKEPFEKRFSLQRDQKNDWVITLPAE